MTANHNPAPTPSKEDLAAYEAALADAHAAIDTAKTAADFALDDVQAARDEARKTYDTSTATRIFSDVIRDINLAARALRDAIDGLPALDEGDGEEEGE